MWNEEFFFSFFSVNLNCAFKVKVTQEAVKSGKCVVIGLQSTGEARTLDALVKRKGELEDYISTAK